MHRLEGEIALARGDRAAAIDRLTLADGNRQSAFTVESLARAHRLAGHRDEAIRLHEQLLSMKAMTLGFEPQQGWLEAHYWLALLRAEAGDRAEAAAASDALLTLWREADADCPMVQAVRELHVRVSRAEGRQPR